MSPRIASNSCASAGLAYASIQVFEFFDIFVKKQYEVAILNVLSAFSLQKCLSSAFCMSFCMSNCMSDTSTCLLHFKEC
jgi:hypothetical protein